MHLILHICCLKLSACVTQIVPAFRQVFIVYAMLSQSSMKRRYFLFLVVSFMDLATVQDNDSLFSFLILKGKYRHLARPFLDEKMLNLLAKRLKLKIRPNH